MNRLHWCKGRVQILALKGEILTRLAKGHSHSEIHRDLTKAGALTVSLRSFHRHTSKYKTIIEEQARTKDLQILYPNGPSPAQTDKQPSLKKEPFKHHANPSDNETDW